MITEVMEVMEARVAVRKRARTNVTVMVALMVKVMVMVRLRVVRSVTVMHGMAMTKTEMWQ
eukprot:7937508-Lingulodinium_polyedra.AAC.1